MLESSFETHSPQGGGRGVLTVGLDHPQPSARAIPGWFGRGLIVASVFCPRLIRLHHDVDLMTAAMTSMSSSSNGMAPRCTIISVMPAAAAAAIAIKA